MPRRITRMTNLLHASALASLALLLASCAIKSDEPGRSETQAAPSTAAGPAAAEPVAGADTAAMASQLLHAVFDEYFEELLQLNPILATSIGDARYNDRFVVSI